MESPVTIGLLLAAGTGRRLGRGPKALLPWHGRTLLAHQCATLRAVLDDVLVVLGAGAEQARPLLPPGCRAVLNDAWAAGLAGSLQRGVAAIGPNVDVVVIALVDQPGMSAGAISRLLAVHRTGRVTVPTYGDGRRWGHPQVWDRRLLGVAAAGAEGDEGARRWLRAHPERIDQVPVPGDGEDLDTPEDWRRISGAWPPRSGPAGTADRPA